MKTWILASEWRGVTDHHWLWLQLSYRSFAFGWSFEFGNYCFIMAGPFTVAIRYD